MNTNQRKARASAERITLSVPRVVLETGRVAHYLVNGANFAYALQTSRYGGLGNLGPTACHGADGCHLDSEQQSRGTYGTWRWATTEDRTCAKCAQAMRTHLAGEVVEK